MALYIILAMILLGAGWFLGGNEVLGYALSSLFYPTKLISKGDKVEVFINGEWNRTATVTATCHDYFTLYDAVRCPIDYRGQFYAIGEDANGNILEYVAHPADHRRIKSAEIIRKVCKLDDCYDNFKPEDDARPLTEVFANIKEKAEQGGDEL